MAAPGGFHRSGPWGPQALPVDPALFVSGGHPGANTRLAATSPDGTPPFRLFRPCSQRHPKLGGAMVANPRPAYLTLTRSHFGPSWRSRKRPEIQGRLALIRCPTGRRSGHSGTLQGATGATQTHPRRTGSKLGRLPRARQGLVPVPESNTKYGGQRGKTRGQPTSRVWPSIGESSRIRQAKKIVAGPCKAGCARCSQGHDLLQTKGCSWETQGKYGSIRAGMPGRE